MASRTLMELTPPDAPGTAYDPRPPAYDDLGAPMDDSREHELWDWTGTGAAWPGGRLETTVVPPNPAVSWRARLRSAGRL